jgi:hypothetical protein
MTKRELLMLESTRVLGQIMNGSESAEQWIDGLLAEAQETMQRKLGRERAHLFEVDSIAQANRIARRDAARARTEQAEERAEATLPESVPETGPEWDPKSLPEDPVAIDRWLRDVCAELSGRDVYFGEVMSAFLDLKGWQVLGYATESQYCRERLGLSRASVRSKVRLAEKGRRLVRIADAVRGGEVGSQAAMLLLRVARPETEEAWLERAKKRTFKLLREDVEAALLASRFDESDAAPRPPTNDEIEAVHDLERDVLSGSLVRRALKVPHVPLHEGDIEPPRVLPPPVARPGVGAGYRNLLASNALLELPSGKLVQMLVDGEAASGDKAIIAKRARALLDDGVKQFVTVRLPESLAWHYRKLEEVFLRCGMGDSFIEFLAVNFWETWHPEMGRCGKWSDVHARDRHRCTNPCCIAFNISLHHLKYRGRGGSDDPSNAATLCPFCHLKGEHEGRLKVVPPAENMKWWIGRTPILFIDGRDKYELNPLRERSDAIWRTLGLEPVAA